MEKPVQVSSPVVDQQPGKPTPKSRPDYTEGLGDDDDGGKPRPPKNDNTSESQLCVHAAQ